MAEVIPDTGSGLASIKVQWTALAADGGSVVLGYYLQRNEGYGSSFAEPGNVIPIGTTEYAVTGLIPGAVFDFRIAAYNRLEADNTFTGDVLNFSNTTSLISAILPPAVSNFKQPTEGYVTGQVLLQWDIPASNGSPITSYSVTRDVGTGVFFKVYQGPAPTYTDTALVPGTSYIYKVAAQNAVGLGPSTTGLVTTASAIPGKISVVSIEL